MRYIGKLAVLIPYINDSDEPDWLRISIDATEFGIDRRRLYRGIRIFIQKNFGKKVSNSFIKKCVQIHFQSKLGTRFKTAEEKREFMDRLVLELQEREDKHAAETGGYTEDQAETPEEARVEVPAL